MIDERNALRALGRLLESLRIRWVLAGALAANRYRSAVRLTQDVDLLLADLGPGLPALQEALEAAGWKVRLASPGGEILRLRHALLGSADLMAVGTDYQREAVARARNETLDGTFSVHVLSPEDVIIHKLIAARTQDIADIEAILAARVPLDEAYIQRWVEFWEAEELWRGLRPT